VTNSAIRTQVILNDPIGFDWHKPDVASVRCASAGERQLLTSRNWFCGLHPGAEPACRIHRSWELALNSGVFSLTPNLLAIHRGRRICHANQRFIAGPSGSFAIMVRNQLT